MRLTAPLQRSRLPSHPPPRGHPDPTQHGDLETRTPDARPDPGELAAPPVPPTSALSQTPQRCSQAGQSSPRLCPATKATGAETALVTRGVQTWTCSARDAAAAARAPPGAHTCSRGEPAEAEAGRGDAAVSQRTGARPQRAAPGVGCAGAHTWLPASVTHPRCDPAGHVNVFMGT